MSREKKLEEFITKYGAHPETEMRLWRIWNTKKWGALSPSDSFDPLFGVSNHFKSYHRQAREERHKLEALELGYYLRGPHANIEPKKGGRRDEAAKLAKQEFKSVFKCYPYEAPEKVLIWCTILDKHLNSANPYTRTRREKKSLFENVVWVPKKAAWFTQDGVGPFKTEHEAHAANVQRRVLDEQGGTRDGDHSTSNNSNTATTRRGPHRGRGGRS